MQIKYQLKQNDNTTHHINTLVTFRQGEYRCFFRNIYSFQLNYLIIKRINDLVNY